MTEMPPWWARWRGPLSCLAALSLTACVLHYEVVFRRADGSTLTRRYDRAPPFAQGETVRLDGAGERDAPAATPF